jgi:tetratricopeptide (TPR) repeat protein
VVGVAIVGGIAFAFYRSEQTAERSESTLQLIQAVGTQDAEVFLTVSDNFPNTAAGDWARLYQGQSYLSQGIQSLFNDRENAEELLSDAQQALRAAISGKKDKLLRSRGQFGIARASEALGEIDEAIEEYKKVIEINESEAMNEKAQERIDALSDPGARAFVSWFADQDFTPRDPSAPPTLPGTGSLPGIPDLDLPPLDLIGGDDDDQESRPRDLEGGLGLPEEGTAPMKDEAASSESEIVLPEGTEIEAAENKANSEEPASTDEPTEDQPAADQPAEDAPADDSVSGDAPGDDSAAGDEATDASASEDENDAADDSNQ